LILLRPGKMEPVAKVGVTVTFLRMDRRPTEPAAALPAGIGVVRLDGCTVGVYRYTSWMRGPGGLSISAISA
jgi:hypothetical protein